MSRTLTLEALREQLQAIDKKLAEFHKLAAERSRIVRLIEAWVAAFPAEKSALPANPAITVAAKKAAAQMNTEEYVFQALAKSGPLFPNQLLIYVRELGWKSKGSDRKDGDRIYQAMKRRPDRFQRMDDGKWVALKEKEMSA